MNTLSLAPSFKLSLLFVTGILLGSQYQFNFLLLSILFLFLMILLLYFYKRKNSFVISFILAALLIIYFGILKAHIDFFIVPGNSIKYIPNTERKLNEKLIGIIKELPDYDSLSIRFILQSHKFLSRRDTIDVSGDVIVTFRENFFKNKNELQPKLEVGDEVLLMGKLTEAFGKRNPGEFNYKKYLELHNIHKIFLINGYENIEIISKENLNFFHQKILFPAKVYALNNIDKNTGGDEASYLKGLVTGERSDISPELKETFVHAGVMHLIAVSGLNVAYIIITITLVLTLFRVPLIPRIIITILFLIFYCLFTGSSASITRATIMGILVLISFVLERRINLYNILGVSSLIILIHDAKQLYDPGFILSFSAILSMIFFYNKFENLFLNRIAHWEIKWKKYIFYVLALFFTTLAAQIGTLPIVAMYFEKISVISLLANLIAVPLANLSLAIGFFQIITSIFSEFLSSVIAETNNLLLTLQLNFIKWCASLNIAYFNFYKFNLINALSYYLVLILLFAIKHKEQVLFRSILSCMIIAAVILFNYDFNKKLRVTFLDVGQGDCAVIQTPDEKIIVVDCGTKSYNYNSGERTIAPYLSRNGIHKIDLLILTHLHLDHIGGANYLLENFKIGKIIESGQKSENEFNYVMDSLILNKNISRETIRSGDMIEDIKDIRIYFVFPSKDFITDDGYTLDNNLNNGSVAFVLKFKDIEFLFTGDIEREAEKFLCEAYSDLLKTNILKVAHHGSITSTTIPFIIKNKPSYSVISCGMFNKFNHPSDIILNRLENMGSEIYRTDTDGAIIMESDGKEIEIVDWK